MSTEQRSGPYWDSESFPTTMDGEDIAGLYQNGTLLLPTMILDPNAAADPLSRLAIEQRNAEADAQNALTAAHNRQVMAARGLINVALEDVTSEGLYKEL